MGAKFPRGGLYDAIVGERQRQYNQLAREFDSLGQMAARSDMLDAQRYALQAAQGQQQMAMGKYFNTGTSGTYTGGISGSTYRWKEERTMSRADFERMESRFWERHASFADGRVHWRLNEKLVYEYLEHLSRNNDPRLYELRSSRRAFDATFGPGAYEQYRGPHFDPMYGDMPPPPPKKKVWRPKQVFRSWSLPKLEVTGDATLLATMEKQRSDSMAMGSDRFHVKHDESLLVALERTFCDWVGKPHIRTDNADKFVVYNPGTVVMMT